MFVLIRHRAFRVVQQHLAKETDVMWTNWKPVVTTSNMLYYRKHSKRWIKKRGFWNHTQPQIKAVKKNKNSSEPRMTPRASTQSCCCLQANAGLVTVRTGGFVPLHPGSGVATANKRSWKVRKQNANILNLQFLSVSLPFTAIHDLFSFTPTCCDLFSVCSAMWRSLDSLGPKGSEKLSSTPKSLMGLASSHCTWPTANRAAASRSYILIQHLSHSIVTV